MTTDAHGHRQLHCICVLNFSCYVFFLVVVSRQGGQSTVSRCCHSDHREEAETNAPHYSVDCLPLRVPLTCRHQQLPSTVGDQLFLSGFTVEFNLLLLCCGRCRIQLSGSSCAYGRLAKTGKEVLLQQLLTQADSSPATVLFSFFFFFLYSCKDALTDRARTLPSEILLAERLARPHPRWSNFSETVWTLSSFIVHLQNTYTKKKYQGEKYEHI